MRLMTWTWPKIACSFHRRWIIFLAKQYKDTPCNKEFQLFDLCCPAIPFIGNFLFILVEHACANPPVPRHGSVDCEHSLFAMRCTLSCKPGYGFSKPPSAVFNCFFNEGVWGPAENMPFPDCSGKTALLLICFWRYRIIRHKMNTICSLKPSMYFMPSVHYAF